ncbi:DUF2244 domain-containing protein [Burkholderia pseudomallei]|uniref:DUF2244 domain-containing protein n=1 Tax=Burkholderia pseudomallei TaxID=28450 RepID=UPI00050DF661|nr:DUF2244 domain-containing protein [Burkholderia pseudomallei]KGD08061.1 hypothetical protein DO70_910 [Burkholderia pseudomallei]
MTARPRTRRHARAHADAGANANANADANADADADVNMKADARCDTRKHAQRHCTHAFVAHDPRLMTRDVAENRRVWLLKRNCALSPRQSLISMGLLAALTLAIAMPFAIAGAWAVFACAIGEIAAMCGCFLRYARHAVDYDCVALTEQRLEVIQCDGAQLRRYDWNPLWVAVDLDAAHARDPTIRIRHGSETVLVGRHVTLARRRHVAGELNAALAASAGDFGDTDFAPSVRQRQPEPLAAHR